MNFSLHRGTGYKKAKSREASGAAFTGRMHILVLDDVQEIVRVMSRIARLEGFSVLTAESNEEALAQIRNAETFASLRMAFLDIEVGEERGTDVYKEIRLKNPSLPVVIMSGSSHHKMLYPILVDDACVSFMAKPFDAATLRELMRDPLAWGGDVTKLFQSDPRMGHHTLAPADL